MDINDFLSLGLTAFPFVMAFVLAIAMFAFGIGLYRAPLVAVVAVVAMTFWESAAYHLLPLQLGISIYPQDILFAIIFVVTLLRMTFKPEASIRLLPTSLLCFLGLMGLSFLIGIATKGKQAGVEFRTDFYLWSAALYFTTFRPDGAWMNRMLSWFTLLGVLMCGIVWYRWAADFFGWTTFNPVWRYADAPGVGFNRVAPSNVAFVIGLALVISCARMTRGGALGFHFLLIPAYLMTLVLLQHRSVWVAAFLPVLLVLSMAGNRQGKGSVLAPAIVIGISVMALVALLSIGRLQSVSSSVVDQATAATSTTNGTFVARVNGWQELLKTWASGGPRGWVIGQQYGSGYSRELNGVEIDVAPHNYYVVVLLRTGVLGICAFLMLIVGMSFRAGRSAVKFPSAMSAPLTAAITLSLLLYSVPYGPSWSCSILIGAVIGYLRKDLTRELRASKSGVVGRPKVRWMATRTSWR